VPFKVGDMIKVGNTSGRVIEINPITTVLLTDNERLISIPNSLFLKEKVENVTPRIWKEILVPISISSNINLPQFESEVLKACNRMRRYLDERFPPILTVKGRDKRSVGLVLTLMVKEPSKKNEIIKEINRKISETEDKMKRRKRRK
jgi:small conductance mechanosensitive channel